MKGAEKCTRKWKRPRIRLVGSFFHLRSTIPQMEQKTKRHQVDHPNPEGGGELESFASVLRPLPPFSEAVKKEATSPGGGPRDARCKKRMGISLGIVSFGSLPALA